jgi:predicted metal-dependent TIM-barrel fold hydrolase
VLPEQHEYNSTKKTTRLWITLQIQDMVVGMKNAWEIVYENNVERYVVESNLPSIIGILTQYEKSIGEDLLIIPNNS